jgi:hypothetical protein
MWKEIVALVTGQSKLTEVSETPSHLSEPIDPLARVNQKIEEYVGSFDEEGQAPWMPSFGTLTREEQRLIVERFATDEGHYPSGSNVRVFRTSLVDDSGNPLYLKTIGDYGVQINSQSFD